MQIKTPCSPTLELEDENALALRLTCLKWLATTCDNSDKEESPIKFFRQMHIVAITPGHSHLNAEIICCCDALFLPHNQPRPSEQRATDN